MHLSRVRWIFEWCRGGAWGCRGRGLQGYVQGGAGVGAGVGARGVQEDPPTRRTTGGQREQETYHMPGDPIGFGG